jgi:C1A family cysteine protease
MTDPIVRFYGRNPDSGPKHLDTRFMHAHRHEMAVPLPPKVDLSDRLLPALDQGELGSCELNAAAKLLEFHYPGFAASRLQMYYDVRTKEGTVTEDAGCETRDVFSMLAETGAMPEDAWPYDIAKFTEAPPPWPHRKKIKSSSRLMDAHEVLACLASGFPLILGFQVPKSFEAPEIARTGVLRSPQQAEPTIGGHGVIVVAYDMNFRQSAVFKASGVDPTLMQDHAIGILNSWGPWGYRKTGIFWMSLRYAVDQSTGADLWTGRI